MGAVNAACSATVGIDLGGTKLAAVLVDKQGSVRHRVWREHRATDYPSALAAVVTAARECAEAIGNPARRASPAGGNGPAADVEAEVRPAAGAGDDPEVRLAAVGLAVAGPLDRDRGRVLAALNLGFADRPMRRDLADRLGVPVVLENDANAAALAEHRRGAGAGARCMVMLTLGTGIGGGIVLDGRLLVGANGAAAELGHLPVVPAGDPCGCGGRGCLERYASGTAIARRANRARLGAAAGSRQVVATAEAGDPAAIGLLRDAGERIGDAVLMLAPAIDPDVVVLGGGLAHGGAAHLIPAVRTRLARSWPFHRQNKPAEVRLSTCGPDGGALGAAELAWTVVHGD